MIEILSHMQFDSAADFVWTAFQNAENRSYPLCENKAQLITEMKKRMADESGEALLCTQNGQITGMMCLFSQREEKYMQTTVLCAPDQAGRTAEEFINYLEENYADCEYCVGIEKCNAVLTKALMRHGFLAVEDSVNMVYDLSAEREFARAENVGRVTVDELSKYLAYHAAHFNDGYWTAERLAPDFSNWLIYTAKTDGHITGAVFLRCNEGKRLAEIVGLDAENADIRKDLLCSVINDLTHFCPQIGTLMMLSEAEADVKAMREVGFTVHSQYCCYCK